jgi:hypothetical protein
MRRAARRDDNEQGIVKALRAAGAEVYFIDQPCDLIVGYQGKTVLLECKDGDKPPSARKLTPNEQKFFDTWNGGPAYVVDSIDAALAVIKSLV